MQVEITALGFLKASIGHDHLVLEVEPGTTVSRLLDEVGLPGDLVLTTAVNGKIVGRDRVLQDGDEVKLVPYTGGG
jgi:sulfur carrier protein ThiS